MRPVEAPFWATLLCAKGLIRLRPRALQTICATQPTALRPYRLRDPTELPLVIHLNTIET